MSTIALQSRRSTALRRRREHQRAGIEHVRQRAGIILRIGRNFRKGDVAGRLDEFLELPVCHRRAVDPEAVDGDAMGRRLFGIMLVGAHAERAAGDNIMSGRYCSARTPISCASENPTRRNPFRMATMRTLHLFPIWRISRVRE